MADNMRRDISDDERDKKLPDPPGQARLVHLDEVKGEFKVAEHDPDIRGWDVRSSDGRTIGTGVFDYPSGEQGVLRIYSVSGQYLQELTWTAADLVYAGNNSTSSKVSASDWIRMAGAPSRIGGAL